MRNGFTLIFAGLLTVAAMAQQPPATAPAGVQQPTMPSGFGAGQQSNESSADFALRQMWESRIEAEWEAIKNKDRKAYGDLLADDYEGVEVDGRGERNKIQALNELSLTNVSAYALFGFKLIPLQSDAAFIVYEVTMRFPPKAQFPYSRVYITELWMKRAGRWKEVHYQETHVK